MLTVAFSANLPAGSRQIRLDFTTENHTRYCDAYGDNVVVKLVHVQRGVLVDEVAAPV